MGVEGWNNWGEISQLINIWKGFSAEKSSEFRNESRSKFMFSSVERFVTKNYWQMQWDRYQNIPDIPI